MVDVTPCVGDHLYSTIQCSPPASSSTDQSCQTEMTMADIAQLEKSATSHMRILFEEVVTSSDESVSFYTGIPGKSTVNGKLCFEKHMNTVKSL